MTHPLETGDEMPRGDEIETPLIEEKQKARPWVRFWARIVDYFIFGIICGVIIGLLDIPTPAYNQPWLGMCVIFLWVFVEAILISTWGSTPGKALMHCHVRRTDGTKLSFLSALNRSFSVWWLGVGAGIPIVSVITMIVACVKLSNLHVTTWDRTGHTVVEHKKVGFWRTIVVIAIMIVFAYILYAGARG
ncbi:MAG: hypothetical protein SP1CHLAM54_01510 [Chlamydiia bacterium]|nr:hypothetical protein [Chlamydiia bacterium]MCH9615070.1 hypothetical protein [Chlamydiia bacterium]MCH9628608.1 hypothetical protein [Chlamydiia bacterium]